jgi:hypothetical protein
VRWVDVAGYIASSLVFLTFYMRGMVPLRLVALCSNVAFLIYAVNLHLAPIAILHAALIPVNLSRLIAIWRADTANLARRTLAKASMKSIASASDCAHRAS